MCQVLCPRSCLKPSTIVLCDPIRVAARCCNLLHVAIGAARRNHLGTAEACQAHYLAVSTVVAVVVVVVVAAVVVVVDSDVDVATD